MARVTVTNANRLALFINRRLLRYLPDLLAGFCVLKIAVIFMPVMTEGGFQRILIFLSLFKIIRCVS